MAVRVFNIETLRSTKRPVRKRGPNFSSKMSAEHFDAVVNPIL